MTELPVVDTHQHLWDLSRFTLPWLEGVDDLNRSFTPADYRSATEGVANLRSVYMEVDLSPDQQAAEVDYVEALCAMPDEPMVAAVVSGRPGEEGFAAWLRRLRDSPCIKGVRQVLHVPDTPAGTCLQPAYLHGVRLLGEAGLRFDVCLRPGDLGDAVRLAAECPDTLLVLDHCGNADPGLVAGRRGDGPPAHDADAWRRRLDELGERANVICKISGIVARAGDTHDLPGLLAPTVDHCLAAFGPDRVVFGGDWPVCTLGASWHQWLEALRDIVSGRPAEEQEKLFYLNAERLYALDNA